MVQRVRSNSRRFTPPRITPPSDDTPPLVWEHDDSLLPAPPQGPLALSYMQRLYWDLHNRASQVHLNIGIAFTLTEDTSLIPLRTALQV